MFDQLVESNYKFSAPNFVFLVFNVAVMEYKNNVKFYLENTSKNIFF